MGINCLVFLTPGILSNYTQGNSYNPHPKGRYLLHIIVIKHIISKIMIILTVSLQ